MNLKRQRPWCIEWSAALFIATAAFLTLVHAGSRSNTEALADWLHYVVWWVFFGSIALAVLSGQRFVRWIFVGAAIFALPEILAHQALWVGVVVLAIYAVAGMAVFKTRRVGVGIAIFFCCFLFGLVCFAFRPMVIVKRTTPAEWDYGVDAVVVLAAALCFLPASEKYFHRRAT